MIDRKAESTTYTTPERGIKRESQISTVVKTSRKHEFIHSQMDQAYYHYEYESRITHKLQKVEKIQQKQALRHTLMKMIFSKQMTFKTVFKNFRSLTYSDLEIVCGGSHPERQIAEDLIWKSKPNLQASLMRSVLKIQYKNKKFQERAPAMKNLSFSPNVNVMICPDQLYSIHIKEKQAILTLIPYVKQNITLVLKKFKKNSEIQSIKFNYCQKVCRKRKQNYVAFIEKLRLIVKLKEELILATKRKAMSEILNKCFNRRDKILAQNLKECHLILQIKKKQIMNKIIVNSSLKVLKTLNLWFRKACIKGNSGKKLSISKVEAVNFYDDNPEEKQEGKKGGQFSKKNKHLEGVSIGTGDPLQSESIEIQAEIEKQVDEEIKLRRENLLKRIIMKKHIAKWAFHARFRRNLEKCAIKFACASKISIQNSFWRLNVNAYQKQ